MNKTNDNLELKIKQTWLHLSVADGQTDGWSGPTTRPAFAKAMQVTFLLNYFEFGPVGSAGDFVYKLFLSRALAAPLFYGAESFVQLW